MDRVLDGRRIFIVEDNVGNVAVMKTLLEFHGAEVSFERWGTKTVEKLTKFMPVDIILLDLMYPREISGYDIFDEIRLVEAFNDIPILAVSASDTSTAIPKCKERGFNGFIVKPVNLDSLPGLLLEAINGKSIWYTGEYRAR